MIADDVTDLVPDHVCELVVVEKADGTRVQNDERLFHAPCPSVYDRGLGDEERILLVDVERLEALLVDLINLRKLLLADLYCTCLKRESKRAFGHKAEDLTKDVVEYRNAPERLQRGLVGRVLP